MIPDAADAQIDDQFPLKTAYFKRRQYSPFESMFRNKKKIWRSREFSAGTLKNT